MKITKIIALAALALTLAGCQTIKYKSTSGAEFAHKKLGFKTDIGTLSVTVDTNGVKTVTLDGYGSDVSEQTSVIAESIARGVVEGLK